MNHHLERQLVSPHHNLCLWQLSGDQNTLKDNTTNTWGHREGNASDDAIYSLWDGTLVTSSGKIDSRYVSVSPRKMFISILLFSFHLVAFSTCRMTLDMHNDLCVAVHIQTLFFHFINSTFELEEFSEEFAHFISWSVENETAKNKMTCLKSPLRGGSKSLLSLRLFPDFRGLQHPSQQP